MEIMADSESAIRQAWIESALVGEFDDKLVEIVELVTERPNPGVAR